MLNYDCIIRRNRIGCSLDCPILIEGECEFEIIIRGLFSDQLEDTEEEVE